MARSDKTMQKPFIVVSSCWHCCVNSVVNRLFLVFLQLTNKKNANVGKASHSAIQTTTSKPLIDIVVAHGL
jgi:hypothetical protein